MKSPTNFIVRPLNGRRYNNIKKIGDVDLITSTSQEDHKVSNRYAEVVSTPINYSGDIQPGDTLIVHHNVFKYYYDMKGRQKSGKSFLMDDLFLVDDYQYYMYKNNNEWKSKEEFCFIKPIPKEEFYIDSHAKNQPLVGKVRYINNTLLSYGVNVDDVVSFKPESEYEFDIDGEKLYRVRTDWITWMQQK